MTIWPAVAQVPVRLHALVSVGPQTCSTVVQARAPLIIASVGPMPAVFRKQLASAQSECIKVQSPPEREAGWVSLVQGLKVQASTPTPFWTYPPSCKNMVCEPENWGMAAIKVDKARQHPPLNAPVHHVMAVLVHGQALRFVWVPFLVKGESEKVIAPGS